MSEPPSAHSANFTAPPSCTSQAITTWKDLGSVTAAEEYVQQVMVDEESGGGVQQVMG